MDARRDPPVVPPPSCGPLSCRSPLGIGGKADPFHAKDLRFDEYRAVALDKDPQTRTPCRVCESGQWAVRFRALSDDVVPFEELQRRVLRDGREVLVDREEFVATDQRARSNETVDP